MRAFILCVFSCVVGACGANPPLYGEQSCKDIDDKPDLNRVPYVTANGNAAVCLERKRVEYMLCARELALLSSSNESSSDLNATVKVEGVAEATFTQKLLEKVEAKWAAEGDLARARAAALNACITMLN